MSATILKRWLRDLVRRSTRITGYVDPDERRLAIQALVIGVVVFAFVLPLELAVNAGFAALMVAIERAPSAALIFVPLILGALVVAAVLRWRRTHIHYRDPEGHVHELDALEGDGLERTIALYFSSEPSFENTLLGEHGVRARWKLPTFSLALRKLGASAGTLMSGGSGGLEASVALVGESVSAGLFKPRPLVESAGRHVGVIGRLWHWWCASQSDDLQAAQICGVAAAIATLFGTPFAAAFFAVEIMYRRRVIVNRLIYALISALVAFFLRHLVHGAHPLFDMPHAVDPPIYEGRYYLALSAVAITVAALAIQFRKLRVATERMFHTIGNRWTRHVVGAVCTGSIALAVVGALGWLGHPDVPAPGKGLALTLGTGKGVIEAALAGGLVAPVALTALAGRLLATLATIASGGSAGLLYPTLCFGALIAAAWATFFEFPAIMLIAPAMTASMVSIANVPLAAILVVIESFGASFMVPSLFMLVLASVLAHSTSIYRPQREAFQQQQQLLPGVSVRRCRVPGAWAGRQLQELDISHRFGLTVIGMIDRRTEADGSFAEHIVMSPPVDQPVTEGDLLIVLGEDERLNQLERTMVAPGPD